MTYAGELALPGGKQVGWSLMAAGAATSETAKAAHMAAAPFLL